MAKATVNIEKQLTNEFVPARYDVKTVEVKTYTLNLSEEEARTLIGVTRKISGSDSGRRGHTDSIQWALEKAGVPNTTLEELTGSLAFPIAW